MKDDNTSRLHYVELYGSPGQRGEIYGETLRSPIQEQVARFMDYIARSIEMSPDDYLQTFLAETQFERTVRVVTPDLWQEVQGMARGSGIDFSTIFALQLMDEEWWYRTEKPFAQQKRSEHCSVVGVLRQPETPTLLAQNMDILGYHDGLQTVLRIQSPDSALETLVLTSAGLIGLNGLNNRPLAVCVNTLSQLKTSRQGLPVAFVVRAVLQQDSLPGAVDFLTTVPHASGQSYLIGAASALVNYECSANRCAPAPLEESPGVICHTNHPLVNDDLSPVPQEDADSETRLATLRQKLKPDPGCLSIEIVKGALRSHTPPEHPICRHYRAADRSMTFASTVMSLSNPPELHLTSGPPCQRADIALGF